MRMTLETFLVLALTGVIALAAMRDIEARQSNRATTWVHESAFTLDDVNKILNKLPSDRALEAKIIVINSQRSAFGALSSPYYVYYRR